jgi:hypothetical protein
LLTAGSPLGLAVGGILLVFVPSTTVIAFSALACILVGLGGLISPTFRGMSLPNEPIIHTTGEQNEIHVADVYR